MTGYGGFPQHFGKFLLTSLLARGGMSQVLLAKSEGVYGFRRLVVVKRMLPVLAEDPDFVAMFDREARLGARLQHPNIVQVFDWGQVESQLYIAMEYVDGLDLRVAMGRLRHEGLRMSLPLCLYVAGEICRGLDYAHRAQDEDGNSLGIVHRDVSPSNVLISRDGAIKVCDFGIATGVQDAVSLPAPIRGKYAYMSPEQASGQAVEPRSDLFSVGLLLWELIVGQRMYRSETEIGTMELAQRAQIARLEGDAVPNRPALQAIFDRVLARDPAARFETAIELRRALMDYARAADLEGGSNELAAFVETSCAPELRRRGQRRDSLPVDSDPTPATPTADLQLPSVAEPVARSGGRARAYVPEVSVEAVSVPELFPEVVSRPLVEKAEIVSRPAESRAPAIEGDRVATPEQAMPAAAASAAPTPGGASTPKAGASSSAADGGAGEAGPESAFVAILRGTLGLDDAALDKARARAEQDGTTLPRALLAEKLVQESALCHAMGEAWGLPTVDLSSWALTGELTARVPEAIAQTWDLVPFRLEKVRNRSALCVAIAEPEARLVEPEIDLGEIQRVKFFLARRSAIQAAFVRLYHGIERPIPPLYPKGISEQ